MEENSQRTVGELTSCKPVEESPLYKSTDGRERHHDHCHFHRKTLQQFMVVLGTTKGLEGGRLHSVKSPPRGYLKRGEEAGGKGTSSTIVASLSRFFQFSSLGGTSCAFAVGL